MLSQLAGSVAGSETEAVSLILQLAETRKLLTTIRLDCKATKITDCRAGGEVGFHSGRKKKRNPARRKQKHFDPETIIKSMTTKITLGSKYHDTVRVLKTSSF